VLLAGDGECLEEESAEKGKAAADILIQANRYH
jgi:hypothetical protein